VDPASGALGQLSPPAIFPTLAKYRPVPDDWKQLALELVALFEFGQRDKAAAYQNVSNMDQLSLGFLQWNHNTLSLYSQLLARPHSNFVEASPSCLQKGVETLVKIAAEKMPEKGSPERDALNLKALAVIESWKAEKGDILPSVRTQLSTWLGTVPLVARQNEIITNLLEKSLAYADAWHRDIGVRGQQTAKRTFLNFVDLFVFSGGLAGLWVGHVKEFRGRFNDSLSMMNYIWEWIEGCSKFEFKGTVGKGTEAYTPTHKQLYRRKEISIAFPEWKRRVVDKDPRIDDNALDLIALGFLRALRSTGTNKPGGFHGVYQLDVLNRRGMIATGVGVENGNNSLVEIYSL